MPFEFGDVGHADRLIANRLTANRLTANRLTANRLTANRLAANSIIANRFIANSIIANRLIASRCGKLTPMSALRRFQGVLESGRMNPGWTIVRIPFEPTKVWPARVRLRVQGSIRSAKTPRAAAAPFRTSLFRVSDGGCILLVNKRMQKAAGISGGSIVEVTIEPDLEERTLTVPPELDKLLRQDRGLRRFHDALSASMRKAMADLITQPKSPAARSSRAELWAERMLLAMEGEHVPPPILEAAFQRNPRARTAWLALTPIQRRSHLMGIFCCQSPESRQKRAEKAIAEALRLSGKKNRRTTQHETAD